MERTIFIGDIQGCFDALQRLLDRLRFDPAADRLALAGDLVNRGGKSLKVLRFLSGLGTPHFSVLGNHDLHLLAYWQMHPRVSKHNPEFERILAHPEGPDALQWLRRQPVLWMDDASRLALVHAGIDPRWDRATASECAGELEQVLRGPGIEAFVHHMYGDDPDHWSPEQHGWVRLRTITNVLTRMRLVTPDGRIELKSSGDLSRAPRAYRPWFELLHPDWHGTRIVFGHWSLLGFYRHADDRAICLDSGCVWGRELTAMVVEGTRCEFVQVTCRR
ncbi:MAG: symmetrical bis(5'-nucleosyl)-tetraphosphatase [Wenzhouxiangellaceae bacterium]